MSHTRRRFLHAAVGASAALSMSRRIGSAQDFSGTVAPLASSAAELPSPQTSGIEHIVVVTMENRSFDHLLGWVTGADGKQAGLSYTDRNGAVHTTYSLGADYTGCGHPDPDHSYDQSRIAYDAGRMDGFLRAGSNDNFSICHSRKLDLNAFSGKSSALRSSTHGGLEGG